MVNHTVEEKIDLVLTALSKPVSAAELSEGWTPESKASIKLFFEELREKIQSREDLPPMSISRALDHWGVRGGELLEISAQISNELRERQK